MKEYLIGLDIGGTKCAVTLAKRKISKAPEILGKKQFPTKRGEPYTSLSEFMHMIDELLGENGIEYADLSAIGISCGGPLDSKNGVILSPPNLPMWDSIPVCEYFESKTGVPCKLQNDANASAIAEWKYGAGRDSDSMVFLTFGTGLGAGLILDGRLYCGHTDNAGEIGHVRLKESGPRGYGKHGSCEGFCSGGGIAQMGVEAMRSHGSDCMLYKACHGDESKVTARLIGDLADQGDKICLGIYEKCAEMLGQTVAILNDILDVECVVIGGIYMRSAHLLIGKMTEAISREALNMPKILPAGLRENVGDYAALSVAEI